VPCGADRDPAARPRKRRGAQGNLPVTRAFRATEAPIGPNFAKFPVIFPVSREYPARDGFARDCLLSQPVLVSRHSPVESLKPGPFPPFSYMKANRRRFPRCATHATSICWSTRRPFPRRALLVAAGDRRAGPALSPRQAAVVTPGGRRPEASNGAPVGKAGSLSPPAVRAKPTHPRVVSLF
jgi:hypothetical protein